MTDKRIEAIMAIANSTYHPSLELSREKMVLPSLVSRDCRYSIIPRIYP